MKKVFVIFLLFHILLSAQPKKFKIGFGLNSYGLIISNGNHDLKTVTTTLTFPLIYNLNFNYIINNSFSLQSKIGLALPVVFFNGVEYGLSGTYNFKNNYFVSIGLLRHNNNNVEKGDLDVNIIFINAGLGYKISRYFSIEAIYFYPLNKEIVWNGSQGSPYVKNPLYIKRIESMIQLGFTFSWGI